jgi:hypothetical protein
MANEAESALGTENTRDALLKLSVAELSNMARSLYGLNIGHETAKKELINLIINATQKFKGNADIQVVSEDAADEEVPEGHVKIRVSPGALNPRNRPIIIGLNFKMASLPVNKPIVMPGKWLTCLQDAVESKAVIGTNEQGREELQWIEQQKHPFTILVDNR